MFRSYLAAAMRNLARDRLHAALNIVGLGAGLGAALLVALYVRHELTFEQFLPRHEDIYRLSNELMSASGTTAATHDTKAPVAEALRLEFPQIRTIAELSRDRGGSTDSQRRGNAVLEDLPSNTHLNTEIFASMRALPPLKVWPFPVAAAVALLIAVTAVSGHSISVARRTPVKALRYE